jgi:hypothetical protein
MNITRCLNFWHLNIIAEQTKSCFFSVPEGIWYWTPSLEIILKASTPSTVTGKYLRRHHSKCLFSTRNSRAALLSQELHKDHLNWDTSLSSVRSLAIDCVARFPLSPFYLHGCTTENSNRKPSVRPKTANDGPSISISRTPTITSENSERKTI